MENTQTISDPRWCIKRSFLWSEDLVKFCTELENGALVGLCDGVSEGLARLLQEKAEICFRRPLIQSQRDLFLPKWWIKELQELEGSYRCTCRVSSLYTLFWNWYFKTHQLYFSGHMHLLDLVGTHLGQFDSWPTYLLLILFCKDPSHTRLKKFAAFCYGNDVPINICSQLYSTCNGKCAFHVVEKLCEFYYVWQRSFVWIFQCLYL